MDTITGAWEAFQAEINQAFDAINRAQEHALLIDGMPNEDIYALIHRDDDDRLTLSGKLHTIRKILNSMPTSAEPDKRPHLWDMIDTSIARATAIDARTYFGKG